MQGRTRQGKYEAKRRTREKRVSSKMVKNRWKKSERKEGMGMDLVSRCIHTMSMSDKKRKRRESKTASVEGEKRNTGR